MESVKEEVKDVIEPKQKIKNWKSGIFDCTDDPNSCLLGCFCTPYLSTKTRADLEGRRYEGLDFLVCCLTCWFNCCWCLWCCQCALDHSNRVAIEQKFNFPQPEGRDWITSLICCCCISCQHRREVDRQIRRGNLKKFEPNSMI